MSSPSSVEVQSEADAVTVGASPTAPQSSAREGVLTDGSRWWRESGVDEGKGGEVRGATRKHNHVGGLQCISDKFPSALFECMSVS